MDPPPNLFVEAGAGPMLDKAKYMFGLGTTRDG
jgi:hypothetical protein